MTDQYRGLKRTGLHFDSFFKVMSARGYSSGNCGLNSRWRKHAEYKFRAIADSPIAERGEIDRYVK